VIAWGVLVLAAVAVEAGADIRPPPPTPHAALRGAPELGDVRTNASFRALADQLTRDAGLATTAGSATSLTAASTIDATADGLGPVFLTRAATLGTAGAVNLNVTGQAITLDTYGGANPLGTGAPPMVVTDADTGGLLGVRMHYALAYHVHAAAVAATVALRDDLDLSLVAPFLHIGFDLAVDAHVVRAARDTRFVPVRHAPVARGAVHLDVAGPGDLTARLKYLLPVGGLFGGDTYTLEVMGVFPTGNADKALGGGTYLVNLGGSGRLPWEIAGHRGELTATATASFDVGDATQARILYGIGASAVLLTRPLLVAGLVEMLGRSQLEPTPAFGESGVAVLTGGSIAVAPALGLDLGRLDTFDVVVGLRVPLGPHVLAFAVAVCPLNDAGLRPSGCSPTIGVGGGF
jgi:hypothetical protein